MRQYHFKSNRRKNEVMKYLITGVHGQLGHDIVEVLKNQGNHEVFAPTRQQLDISNRDQVMTYVAQVEPDVIIHCAAYTKVDLAEKDKENCYLANVMGTKNLVDAASVLPIKFIYLSTDYVFDGTRKGTYNETDITNPQSVYGMSKYLGEKIVETIPYHFIARISWVFGMNGHNFVKTMLNLSENHSQLNVVADQIGSPTYTKDLAKLLVDMSQTEKYGTYHITNEGYCSWAEFANYIFKTANRKTIVNEVTTEEYLALTNNQQAYRPRNSKLSKDKIKANFYALPTWQDATDRYIKELKKVK